MKKVIVLFAAVSLMATSAMATVVGTAHDLSATGTGPITSNYSEVCVFCHTPHAANTAVTNAPLWNRATVAGGATGVYAGLDLETPTAAVTTTDIDNTDALLCLSCHEGALATGNLQNPSNLAGGGQPTFNGNAIGANSNLGTNCDNDHPIGFNFVDVANLDAEISNTMNGNSLPLFAGDMWCSTCHDVHDDTASPFLQLDNSGSNLCLACHNT